MAVNTLSLCFAPLSSSSSFSSLKPQFAAAEKRLVSCSAPLSSSSSSSVHFAHRRLLCSGVIFFPQPRTLDFASSSFFLAGHSTRARVCTALAAVVDEKAVVTDGEEYVDGQNDDVSDEEERGKLQKPCEVYVCNLPRSCDAAQLHDMFKPYGTVLSLEVSRNAESGESKGCGYVTMGSVISARNAIAALDRSDVGGREMRVRFSVEMNPERRNPETVKSSPKRVMYYEAPHKLYVGNLARAVRPEELRYLFSRFGAVASVRVLQDRKNEKNRAYAFVSFLSETERDAATSLNGTELCGRTLVIRKGVERKDT